MADVVPNQPSSAPSPLPETPEGLIAEQQKTSKMMAELLQKAHSPELFGQGKQVADRLARVSERLQQITGRSQEVQLRSAAEAQRAFQQRLDNPTWQDKLYQHKEVILAGAAVLAIGAWVFMKESPVKKWGMTALALVTGGFIGKEYLDEQDLKKAPQNTPPGNPAHPQPPKDEKPEVGKNGVLTAMEIAAKKGEDADRQYRIALDRAAVIRRDGLIPTPEDRLLFQQTIASLHEAMKATGDQHERDEYLRKVMLFEDLATNPNNRRELLEKVNGIYDVVSTYFEISMVSIPITYIAKVVREEKVGNLIIQGVRSGHLEYAELIVRNHLQLDKEVNFLRQAEELVELKKAGKFQSARYNELFAELYAQGIKGDTAAAEVVRKFSKRNALVRWLFTEWDGYKKVEMFQSILSPGLQRMVRTNPEAFQKLFKGFIEAGEGGGRRFAQLLERLNSLENAEQVYARLVVYDLDAVTNIMRTHGIEVIEALAVHANDDVKFVKLLEVLKEMKTPLKNLPVKCWGMVFGKILKGASENKTIANLAAEATAVMTKWGNLLEVVKVAGIALEVGMAMMYFAEAGQIDTMINNIRAFASEDRVRVLRDRVNRKIIFGGVNLALGLVSIFGSGPIAPLAAAAAILSMGVESWKESVSEATERRTRSPQEWASERSRENLVQLWCTQRGLSDGDRLGLSVMEWIWDGPDRKRLETTSNIETRKHLLKGILIQEEGITDGEIGKQLIEESETLPQDSKLIDAAQTIRFRLDFITRLRPQCDPDDPILANRLLSQSRIYAQMQMEALRLRKISTELENLQRGLATPLKKEFELYLEDEVLAGRLTSVELPEGKRAEFIMRFAQQRYPKVNPAQRAVYENIRPSLDSLQQYMTSQAITPEQFFLTKTNPEEVNRYGGLLQIAPLSGSLFDQRGVEQAESIRIRQAFEGRLVDLYSLLALEEQSHRPLEHHDEIDQGYAFCQRYYQAVYGVPFQPATSTAGLTEERIYHWLQSLLLSRREGYTFDSQQTADRDSARGMALSDQDIQLNFQVTRQREVQSLYAFASTLGYRGPMKKELIQAYFSDEKKNDFGFYFTGTQWEIVRHGAHFNQDFEDWTKEQLKKTDLAADRRIFLQKAKGGQISVWEDNPMVIDFLIDYCTKYKANMITHEDDRWWVPMADEQSQFATERIGQSYADFLRSQRESVSSQNTPEARKNFQNELTELLKKNTQGYLVLPPALLRQGYLAGFDNLGMFSYKLVNDKIVAWQLGFLPSNTKPPFIGTVANASEAQGRQFDSDIDQSYKDLAAEQAEHSSILLKARRELQEKVLGITGLSPDKKGNLGSAIASITDDFMELDKVVYDPKFDILPAHKRAFAEKMRLYIVEVSNLVNQLREESSNTENFSQIFRLRNVVHKLKQLYLITFLNKSVNAESWFIFFNDYAVHQPSDYVKIEEDIDNHLNQYTIGNLYENQPGVKEFMEKSRTELTVSLGYYPDSPEKEIYREYALRETAQLVYLANAYGFNEQGFLNDSPAHPSRLEGKDLENLQHLLTMRRLDFRSWIMAYQGLDKSKADQLSVFNVQNHRRDVEATLREQQRGISETRDYGPNATFQAKAILTMCLAFKEQVHQIQLDDPTVKLENFPELNTIYQIFDGQEFLKGGVEKMGYIEAFTANLNRMEDKERGNFAYRIDGFYQGYNDIMQMGLRSLWRYLELPKRFRDSAHSSFGDQEKNPANIRKVVALFDLMKEQHKRSFDATEARTDFTWYQIARDTTFQRHDDALWNLSPRQRSLLAYRAGPDEARIFTWLGDDIGRYQSAVDQIRQIDPQQPGVATLVDNFDRQYTEVSSAVRFMIAKIEDGRIEVPWEEVNLLRGKLLNVKSAYLAIVTKMGILK